MKSIGTYEAKTHLAQILEMVARGESFTITRHGIPIATLRPAEASRQAPVSEVIEQMKQFRKGQSLGGMSIREMIEKGRR